MSSADVVILLVVVVGALVAMGIALAGGVLNHATAGPRVRPRRLPTLASGLDAPAAATPVVTVAGRSYIVADSHDVMSGETCPWCLRSLDGADRSDVVRCDKPFCRQAAHRRHNLEGGGCGGMCSITGR